MKVLFLVFLSLVVLQSCEESKPDTKLDGKNKVRYAKNLRITEQKLTTKIEILSPETGKVEQTMQVSKEIVQTTHFKKVPVKRLAVLSSTHVGMLEILGEIDKIVGVTDRLYVHNPQLMKNIENGKVVELGEEKQIPVEKLLQSKCDVLVYSGFGKEFPHEKQLNGAGITCLVNYDWRETHPLGKAEWILLFGYLMGKEKEAYAYFQKIEKEYVTLKQKAAQCKEKPSVLSGNLVGETWFAPAGGSFNAQLFEDAHVQYVYAKTEGTGSLALTLERILTDNVDTEFWINTGMPTQAKIFGFQPKLKLLGPISKNPIYDYSRSGNRYWEMSAIEPHKVLSDYLQIFHPKEFNEKPLHFYKLVK